MLKQREQRIVREIERFVPNNIIDVHTHVGRINFVNPQVTTASAKRDHALAIARAMGPITLRRMAKIIFPGKKVKYIIFPFPFRETNVKAANKYVLELSKAHPEWGPVALGTKYDIKYTKHLLKQGFLAIKMHSAQLKRKAQTIKITSVFPRKILEAADAKNLPLIIHLPAERGLADKSMQQEILQLSSDYPNAKFILAHMGRNRAVMPTEIANGYRAIKFQQNIFLETSACTSSKTFEIALQEIGPNRIMYGSDLPFSIARGKAVITPKKKYVYIGTKMPWATENMKKKYASRIPKLIMLNLESMHALKRACERVGLNEKEIKSIFFDNASKHLKPQPQ